MRACLSLAATMSDVLQSKYGPNLGAQSRAEGIHVNRFLGCPAISYKIVFSSLFGV